jgi:thioredoxin-related protein
MRMKVLFLLLIGFTPVVTDWQHDIEKAKQEAKQDHKVILLNFSGSDWCIPCINMERQVFEDAEFKSYADKHLVLMRADFPRLKKNALARDLQLNNEALAEKYNQKGSFPYTVLLDASGKVLKSWEGKPDVSTAEFINQIRATVDAVKWE